MVCVASGTKCDSQFNESSESDELGEFQQEQSINQVSKSEEESETFTQASTMRAFEPNSFLNFRLRKTNSIYWWAI